MQTYINITIILLTFHLQHITRAMNHRVHHKWNETSADPYSTTRGYFFAHIGWMLTKRHPEYYEKEALIDGSDLLNDNVVAFQRK